MAYEKEILAWYEEYEENEKNRALLEWFNNDEQNQALLKLYNSKSEVIKEIEAVSKERLALLLSAVPQNYQKAQYKIMVIGQELNGGFGIKEEPRISMLDNLKAQSKKPIKRNFSKFANFSVKFCKSMNKINRDISSYFIWAEIRKFSYWKSPKDKSRKPKKPLSEEVQNIIDKKFNILKDEIKIINPDIVLFLTGHDYDCYIKTQLEGVDFKAVKGYKENQFARVEHEVLPEKSFRIYHPNAFRQGSVIKMFGRGHLYKEFLKRLIEECKK